MSKKNRRKWKRTPTGIKIQALARMKLGENVSHLAKELEVDRSLLYIWRKQLENSPDAADMKDREVERLREKMAQLEGTIGRQKVELDFFRSALRRVEESRRNKGINGETASTRKSGDGCKRRAE
jgi:transposase-like protein